MELGGSRGAAPKPHEVTPSPSKAGDKNSPIDKDTPGSSLPPLNSPNLYPGYNSGPFGSIPSEMLLYPTYGNVSFPPVSSHSNIPGFSHKPGPYSEYSLQ